MEESEIKTFYVVGFGNVGEQNLWTFVPFDGFKHPRDLAVNESTTGKFTNPTYDKKPERIIRIAGAILAAGLLAAGAYAGARAANAYRAVKVSTTTVLIGCNDEREPVISRLANTTAIVVTCKE